MIIKRAVSKLHLRILAPTSGLDLCLAGIMVHIPFAAAIAVRTEILKLLVKLSIIDTDLEGF